MKAQTSNAIRFITIILLIFIFCNIVSAQSNILNETLQKQIDTIFQNKSSEQLQTLLKSKKGTAEYSGIEDYAMRKIRQAIIFNDLGFSREATVAIIDNNLDNFEAVDMYAIVNKAIIKREIQEKASEEKRLAQQAKEAEQAEKVIDKIEKEFQGVKNPETGTTVYYSQPMNERFSPLVWSANIGITDLSLITTPTVTNLKYGLQFFGDVVYYAKTLSFGLDLEGSIALLSFIGSDSFISSGKIVPMIAFPKIKDRLFFRFGFLFQNSNPEKDGTSLSPFFSPLIGIGLKDIGLGSNRLECSIDYLAGHLATETVRFAAEGNCNLLIPMAEIGSSQIRFKTGLSDRILITNNGVENHGKLTLSIGVGNYE